MTLTWFFITLGIIGLVVTFIGAIIFFRRIYYMIDEVDARLVQIRNIMETGSASGKLQPAKRNQAGQTGQPDSTQATCQQ